MGWDQMRSGSWANDTSRTTERFRARNIAEAFRPRSKKKQGFEKDHRDARGPLRSWLCRATHNSQFNRQQNRTLTEYLYRVVGDIGPAQALLKEDRLTSLHHVSGNHGLGVLRVARGELRESR